MGNPRDVNDVHQFHARAGLLHGSAPEVCARRVRVTPGPSGLGGDPASRCAPGPRLAAKLVATQARERAMSRNNSERIRQAIADLIERAPEVGPGTLPDWQEEGRAILRAGFGQDDDILARFNVISYVPHSLSRGSMGGGAADNARRSGVRRAVAILKAALLELDLAEPDEPTIDIAGLHPWVSGVATGLWDNGGIVSLSPKRHGTSRCNYEPS